MTGLQAAPEPTPTNYFKATLAARGAGPSLRVYATAPLPARGAQQESQVQREGSKPPSPMGTGHTAAKAGVPTPQMASREDCRELWCRSQMQLRSGVAVAVV